VKKLHPKFIQLDVLENIRGPLIIVPESGTQGELFILGNFYLSVLDVKETSSGPPPGPSYPEFFLLS
jgi:hypothetical protein